MYKVWLDAAQYVLLKQFTLHESIREQPTACPTNSQQ